MASRVTPSRRKGTSSTRGRGIDAAGSACRLDGVADVGALDLQPGPSLQHRVVDRGAGRPGRTQEQPGGDNKARDGAIRRTFTERGVHVCAQCQCQRHGR